jgi:IS605 OrfB family transposase
LKFEASKVVKHKDGDYYYLPVSQELSAKKIEEASTFMGVDLGINFLAVASTTDKKCKFFAVGEIKNKRNVYKNMRLRLQSKGALSAKRMVKHLASKEKCLITDVNHCIFKAIVKFAVENGVSVIGLEDLIGIRDRTNNNLRKKQKCFHNNWAFYQLQQFIEYEAKSSEIIKGYVNYEYTSKACCRCNCISKNNRSGVKFLCKVCGFELNADLNGARNIEYRTRDTMYILDSQGCLSATNADNMIRFIRDIHACYFTSR